MIGWFSVMMGIGGAICLAQGHPDGFGGGMVVMLVGLFIAGHIAS